jgi:N-ethylmaleimide reductase
MSSDATVSTLKLLTPVRLGDLELPNRVLMAPMTRRRAAAGNVPTELNATYYAQRASAGLIVTEATQVSPRGVGYPDTPGIHAEAQVQGWRLVTDAVHQRGGRIFLQLWHVGRISHPDLQPGGELPIAPSAIAPAGQAMTAAGFKPFVTPRALDLAEIPGVVAEFAAGARRAREAGFDGVEIHGANGYLIDQFLRSGSNARTDAYGGPLENRARFLVEVARAVVAAWGGGGRVGVRLSPANAFNDMHDDDPIATFSHAAEALNELGLAYLHVVEQRPIPDDGPHVTPALRRAFRGPLVLNGGFDRDTAEAALRAGEGDAVAFAVKFLANPDLPLRLAVDAPLNLPDRATMYGGDATGYTDYPALDGPPAPAAAAPALAAAATPAATGAAGTAAAAGTSA